MKKISIDIAYDTCDELLKTFENLTRIGIKYKILQAKGPGGDWPEIELTGTITKLNHWLAKHGYDILVK